MLEVTEQPAKRPLAPKQGKSLLGFYIALGVVAALVGLGVWLWAPMRTRYRDWQVSTSTHKKGSAHVSVQSADDYLAAIATLELDPQEYKSYQDYWSLVNERMRTWLGVVNAPEDLERLFWACQKRSDAEPEDQGRLQWVNPYYESRNLILYRLADIGTPEAARILVDLRFAPEAGWDGGASLLAGDAVVICGRVALPFLREKLRSGENASRLIELIEAGVKTGI